MRVVYRVDPVELALYTAGVRRAVVANRGREAWEKGAVARARRARVRRKLRKEATSA